ncbi:hypothetical protein Cch01nite_39370 [Cellulomonas chitinilytica]|uniref:Uncharacterized protein n=1 Tax=Cellulomonas chitinilytica TaxID=398759 RepID=A0A919U1J5_9CELL|nr:hypothetical protein [Cellulomonas chitinilytica]GIG23213.1 hypothetical protein Cch01nite_39370 [Cellulomonas chitinilytica]
MSTSTDEKRTASTRDEAARRTPARRPAPPSGPQWWAGQRFTRVRPLVLRKSLNDRLDELGAGLTKVLAERKLTAEEIADVHADLRVANRRSSVTWATQLVAGHAVAWVYDAAPILATTFVVLWMSQLGPLVAVALVTVTAVVLFPAERVSAPNRVGVVHGWLWGALCGVLILLPADAGTTWRALAAVATYVATLLVLWVGLVLLKLLPLSWALGLTLVGSSALLAGVLYGADGIGRRVDVLVVGAPDRLAPGIVGGLVFGAATSVLIVVIQLLNQGALRWQLRSRLRRAPEAEFVQSVMWLMATRRGSSTPHSSILDRVCDATDPRRGVAEQLAWIARVMETGVASHMCRLDPRNATALSRTFERKAAVVHRWNRDLLLGDTRSDAQLDEALWDAVLAGTARRWSALPEADVDTAPIVRVGQRVRAWVGKVTALAVAVAATVAAHLNDRDELSLTTGVAALWLLLDLVTPDAGSKLGKAVSETKGLWAMLPGQSQRP